MDNYRKKLQKQIIKSFVSFESIVLGNLAGLKQTEIFYGHMLSVYSDLHLSSIRKKKRKKKIKDLKKRTFYNR